MAGTSNRPLSTSHKLAILAGVAAAYGSNFWPSPQVRIAGIRGLDLIRYERWGIFLPHLLFYSTLMAVVSAVLWLVMARRGILPKPQLGGFGKAMLPGLIGGLVGLAASIAVAFITMPNSVHWIAPNAWKIGGNIFSNFYEEFVFRGFLLTGLWRVTGFWPAALLSSVAWAFLHIQYPLPYQVLILGLGVGFCWLVRHTKSLWAPYFAHEVLDILGDSLIG